MKIIYKDNIDKKIVSVKKKYKKNKSNYTDNFGYQWNKFVKTQIDDNELKISKNRFFNETKFSKIDMDSKNILEVGSGAGRFTNIILNFSNAKLYSIDSSDSVYANFENNKNFVENDRLILHKCSLYELPFKENQFDIVICLGVIQHTPNIEKTITCLTSQLKKGGVIVVDFYPYKGFWTFIHAKYLFRIFTKKMSNDNLYNFINKYLDLNIKIYFFLNKIGMYIFTRFLPLPDIKKTIPINLEYKKLRELVFLDTFDMLSPMYDKPQKISKIKKLIENNGVKILFSGMQKYGNFSSAVVKGVKK